MEIWHRSEQKKNMTKNFSYDKYPSREMEDLGTPHWLALEFKHRGDWWKNVALIGWTLLLLPAFHSYVLPNLI